MVNIFLIVASVVAFAILCVVGFYLLVHFSHPDDKDEAWAPKAVVLLAFVLAGGTVLLLPLDVANQGGSAACSNGYGGNETNCGGLPMNFLWATSSILLWIWLVVLIPFYTFYYEADDGTLMQGTAMAKKERKQSRLMAAAKWQAAVLIVSGLIFVLTYFFLRETQIPVVEYRYTGGLPFTDDTAIGLETVPLYDSNNTLINFAPDTHLQDVAETEFQASLDRVTSVKYDTIEMNVNVTTYFVAMLSLIGWVFLSLFGGIGLAALPLDLIMAFRNRPRHMDAAEMDDAKRSIQERVNELVDIGEMIRLDRSERYGEGDGDAASSDRSGGGITGWFKSATGATSGGSSGVTRRQRLEDHQTLLKFKQAVFVMERDVEDFMACTSSYNQYNPLFPYMSLVAGIIGIILSIFWVLQIALVVLPPKPVYPLLNNYFRWFDTWFPLFGVLSVAIFTFYLLLCAVKGCFKFGLRFVFLIQIHPMVVGKTYMSSFLFNMALLLLCAAPVVQLSTEAFADYTRNASIHQIFGTQIKYMRFFRWVYQDKVFVYIMLACFLLACLYLACKPRDRGVDGTELRDRLKGRRS